MSRWMVVSIILIGVLGLVSAQAIDCPDLAETAIDTAEESCTTIGRNEICYGNQMLNASARESQTLTFEHPGDLVTVERVERIDLSPMDMEHDIWGIALMRIQADVPDTLPGQNVTIVLFGDVQIENIAIDTPTTPMTATTTVNVRQSPSTNGRNILTSLHENQAVDATGILADGSWIRIDTNTGIKGWVSADYLSGDTSILAEVAGDSYDYQPMQAFILQSGIGDSPCLEAPSSGILIQTPDGVGEIRFLINGVDIELGSTVYLQAQADDHLLIYVLEGQATLTVGDATQIVPAGTVSRVALDANGLASDSPEFPEPYTRLAVARTPLRLLPESIRIATPLRADAIEDAINSPRPNISNSSGGQAQVAPPSDGLPPTGRWANTATVIANTCGPDTIPVGSVGTATAFLSFSDDRSSVTFSFGPGTDTITLSRVSDTTYVYSFGGRVNVMTFTSSTSYFMTHRGDFNTCIYYQDESGVFIGY